MTEEFSELEKKKEDKFQRRLGLTIALIAAIFSITSLVSSKFSSNQSSADLKIAYMHDWYNTKGIKQNLAEGQRDLLKALLESGTIAKDRVATIEKNIEATNANIARYKKEKNEMTLGSKMVGKENWAQDIEGKLGLIIGTRELARIVDGLGHALYFFHMSALFFQLSLFMGALSLMMSELKIRNILYWVLVSLGATGLFLAIYALLIGKSVG